MEEYKPGVLKYFKNGEIKSSKDIQRDTNIFVTLLLLSIFGGFILFVGVALFIESGYSIF